MQRDCFTFRRSYYEAIRLLPPEVQAEVYPALIEYALNDHLPDDLSSVSRSLLMLICQAIDTDASRRRKGRAAGRKGGRPIGARTRKDTPALPVQPVQPLDIDDMRGALALSADRSWNEATCMNYSIDMDELHRRIEAFMLHCKSDCAGQTHTDVNDAKRHFCAWMRKAYPPVKPAEKPASYDAAGFGSSDI